jgi:hypothetical protein
MENSDRTLSCWVYNFKQVFERWECLILGPLKTIEPFNYCVKDNFGSKAIEQPMQNLDNFFNGGYHYALTSDPDAQFFSNLTIQRSFLGPMHCADMLPSLTMLSKKRYIPYNTEEGYFQACHDAISMSLIDLSMSFTDLTKDYDLCDGLKEHVYAPPFSYFEFCKYVEKLCLADQPREDEMIEWLRVECCTTWNKMDRKGNFFVGFWAYPNDSDEQKNAFSLTLEDNIKGLLELPFPRRMVMKSVKIGCRLGTESVQYSAFLCAWMDIMIHKMEMLDTLTKIATYELNCQHLPLPFVLNENFI